jgi:diacylglycerol kinase family enzyme
MAASSLETLERLATPVDTTVPSKRMLIIVNPYASTVSDRLKHLVVAALQGRYEVDSVETEARNHATELCREAADEGYDVVVAFGGDGTVNEAANGLAGSTTPLTCLPGGRTNVFCRMLGIPNDVVDATEHLLAIADDWQPRQVDLGIVNERRFLFSSGVGLDANVVERVDAHPRLKRRLGEWYFVWAAVTAFARRYVVRPPRLSLDVDGNSVHGVTAIVQNAQPYTYFDRRPIQFAENVPLDGGTLGGVVLQRANPIDVPTIALRAFSDALRMSRHRRVHAFNEETDLLVRSLDDRQLPLQVDGDYIGDVDEARYSVLPGALTVVS